MHSGSRYPLSNVGASLSGPIANLSDTPITEVAMSVFGDPDVVPLWFGEGDLVTPDFVREAAAKGLQAGETFYTWQRGIPELRMALSAYTERLYGITKEVMNGRGQARAMGVEPRNADQTYELIKIAESVGLATKNLRSGTDDPSAGPSAHVVPAVSRRNAGTKT